MLYHVAQYLQQYISCCNVVHYVSFRVMASLLTALGLSFAFGSWFIGISARFRSAVREYTPVSHQAKHATPTMGGIFVLCITLATSLLWCDLTSLHVWILLGCMTGFACIGFWDDWNKIRYSKGIKESYKFRAQCLVAALVALLWYWFISPPYSAAR